MTFEIKQVTGKTGIEVTRRDIVNGQERVIAAHFYEKNEIDDEVKKYLNEGVK